MAEEAKKSEGAVVYQLTTVRKGASNIDPANAPADAVRSNAAQPEDEFTSFYLGGVNDRALIPPPFDPRRLDRLSMENNTLGPCIEAMVTNIDGTGYEFDVDEQTKRKQAFDAKVQDFQAKQQAKAQQAEAGKAQQDKQTQTQDALDQHDQTMRDLTVQSAQLAVDHSAQDLKDKKNPPKQPTQKLDPGTDPAKTPDPAAKDGPAKGGIQSKPGADKSKVNSNADAGDDAAPQLDEKIEALHEFFDEPWPGESFVTMRKKLRRDVKRTGNGYLEVIRNPQDAITFIRHVDAKMMRMVKLDAAVPVDKKVKRGGKDINVKVLVRERRFVQMLWGKTLVYFKEFGASRDLNKNTGEWAPAGQRLPANVRATEMMHFIDLPDSHTPYGVPSWVAQMPSVLGSRKAEEFNNDFFDNGGVPPALILLQGGTLMAETRRALEMMTSGNAKNNNRIQTLEVAPAGGSIQNPGNVRVTVERFGAERQNDSMFDKYDDKCEARVRRSFRLPPIFLGAAADYNFATAFASITMTEAQVFKPERDEFDEQMSIRLFPAMGFDGYVLRSKPVSISDPQFKMAGITAADATNMVAPEDIIDAINETVGTNFKVAPAPVREPQIPTMNVALPGGGDGFGKPPTPKPAGAGASGGDKGTGAPVKKSEGIAALAIDLQQSIRKRDAMALLKNLELANGLGNDERDQLTKTLATLQFVDPSIDTAGLAELAGCTVAVMAHQYGQSRH